MSSRGEASKGLGEEAACAEGSRSVAAGPQASLWRGDKRPRGQGVATLGIEAAVGWADVRRGVA